MNKHEQEDLLFGKVALLFLAYWPSIHPSSASTTNQGVPWAKGVTFCHVKLSLRVWRSVAAKAVISKTNTKVSVVHLQTHLVAHRRSHVGQ